MLENDLKQMTDILDSLVADIGTMDVDSPDDLMNVLNKMNNISAILEKNNEKNGPQLVSLISDRMSTIKPGKNFLLEKLLKYGVGILQETVSDVADGTNAAKDFDSIKFEIDQILALSADSSDSADSGEKENDCKCANGSNVKNVKNVNADDALISDFSPCVPVIDLSEGISMIVDFIDETREHLVGAEENLIILETDPNCSECIKKLFREYHTIKGLAGFFGLNDVKILTHDTETLMDQVRKGKLKLDGDIIKALFKSVDAIRKLIDLLSMQVKQGGKFTGNYYDISQVLKEIRGVVKESPKGTTAPVGQSKKLGGILLDKGVITSAELDEALSKQQKKDESSKLGEVLVKEGIATPSQVERGLYAQKDAMIVDGVIKVSSSKIDSLFKIFQDLISSVKQIFNDSSVRGLLKEKLHEDIAKVDALVEALNKTFHSIKLVAVKPVFHKLSRLVHDLALKSGKKIDLKIIGEETEIDKTVADLIEAPLIHIIRNAIDHGIEDVDARLASGKTESGVITLSAGRERGETVIAVSDDGGGIPVDKIKEKAIKRGLVKSGELLTDQKIYDIIFMPGFSSSDNVTDVSGRGIGMDIVKNNMKSINGKTEVVTEKGQGTTIILKIPERVGH